MADEFASGFYRDEDGALVVVGKDGDPVGVGDVTQAELAAVEADVAAIESTLVAVCRFDGVEEEWPPRPDCVLCIFEGPTAEQGAITDDAAGDLFFSSDGA